MATVEMSFTPLPAHVRTARLVATAVARRSGVAEELLDEVRLAVGEACSRAVEAHREHCPDEPVRVALTSADGRFEVIVTDTIPAPEAAAPAVAASRGAGGGRPRDGAGPGVAGLAQFEPQELGLAVIAGLADDVEVARTGSGLSIRMAWPSSPAADQDRPG